MIDYLKFDIEGFEWNVLKDINTHQSIHEKVKQIGFEIHTKLLMRCYNGEKVSSEFHTKHQMRCYSGEKVSSEIHTKHLM